MKKAFTLSGFSGSTRFIPAILMASMLSVPLAAVAVPGGNILETEAIIFNDVRELSASIAPSKSFFSANEDVMMRVTFTNYGQSAIQVPAWLLDGRIPDHTFLSVTLDGEAVPYTGAIAKRATLAKQELVELNPGDTITVELNIGQSFDLSTGGVFEVKFNGSDKHVLDGASVGSESAFMAVEANPFAQSMSSILTQAKVAGGGGISFTGACSSSRQTAVRNAVPAATTYAANAQSYLSATPSATPRYTTWFGALNTTRWNTVKSHFTNINSALNTKPLVFDCSCTDSGTFAYVYPNQPYKIYLCGAFWAAANTGTDSRAGTIVHEMSHFTVNGGTQDNAYGQTAAKNLARTNPAKAVQNADSHEYFAENTPFQN
jgi:peptidyl-Lys metalloendopeptidase